MQRCCLQAAAIFFQVHYKNQYSDGGCKEKEKRASFTSVWPPEHHIWPYGHEWCPYSIIAIYRYLYLTYMQECISLIIDPSNDNVRVWHISSRRESQSNPSSGVHSHCKPDSLDLHIKAPVKFIAFPQLLRERITGQIHMRS